MAFLRFKNDFLAHYDELCAAVRQSGEPVYIENEDGEADMVLLSVQEYRRLTQQSVLQQFFAAGVQDGAAGRRPEVDVLAELQKQEDEEGG